MNTDGQKVMNDSTGGNGAKREGEAWTQRPKRQKVQPRMTRITRKELRQKDWGAKICRRTESKEVEGSTTKNTNDTKSVKANGAFALR